MENRRRKSKTRRSAKNNRPSNNAFSSERYVDRALRQPRAVSSETAMPTAVVSPINRCYSEKRNSDSSSSQSVQENNQSKQEILRKSRQRHSKRKQEEESYKMGNTTEETITTGEEVEPEVKTPRGVSPYETGISTCLRAFASMCDTVTPEILHNQFYSLPLPDPKECVVFAHPANAMMNRYSNIPCLDSSRILLEFLVTECGVEYIHANRVRYPLLRNEFIITQGPLARTVPEFWRMIWQEKVESIIMLCKTVEDGRRKCSEYFSSTINLPTSYADGKLTTILRSWNRENDLVVSTIEFKYLSYSRTVIHYHWTGWPDFHAPTDNAATMFSILRRVRGSKTPVVVHCSAGVGRSGTMVALEMCLMTIANTRPIDIQSIVSSLRRCRALAVQSLEQYLSLYQLVLRFGQQNGYIAYKDVERFYRKVQNL